MHILEETVKFLCEKSQKPNDDFDILAKKLGGYRDQQSLELKGSEAVFGFLGWLTTRDEVTIFSKSHEASVGASLAGKFCDVNKLPEPREDWTNNLTHPKEK